MESGWGDIGRARPGGSRACTWAVALGGAGRILGADPSSGMLVCSDLLRIILFTQGLGSRALLCSLWTLSRPLPVPELEFRVPVIVVDLSAIRFPFELLGFTFLAGWY